MAPVHLLKFLVGSYLSLNLLCCRPPIILVFPVKA
jgi:hypothetical protein